jgi:hypothetical protein
MWTEVTLHEHVGAAVITIERDTVTVPLLDNVEVGVVVHAGEELATHKGLESGRSIPARDLHAFSEQPIVVPLYSDPMSRVFRSQPKAAWDKLRSNVPETDQADACDANTRTSLGRKGGGRTAADTSGSTW